MLSAKDREKRELEDKALAKLIREDDYTEEHPSVAAAARRWGMPATTKTTAKERAQKKLEKLDPHTGRNKYTGETDMELITRHMREQAVKYGIKPDETRGPLKEIPVNETEKQREMRMAREDADAAIARAKERKLKVIAEKIKKSSAARKITAIIRKAAEKKKLTRAEKALVEDEIGEIWDPDDLPDLEELSVKNAPQPVDSDKTCPRTPNKPTTSVRQTKMAMRGPNPNRKGWKLPRKPYGHSREVVELEDDLNDDEMRRMTSELPRRCLVEAVQRWAGEHNKIVLPSITRADKVEIVATIKEHRIPVPRMEGGGYYGDKMRGGGEFDDWIENERRTTQPYEIVGEGGAEPVDKDLYEKAKSEVYPKYDKPSAYRSGALVKRYKELGGTFKDTGGKPLARWFKEDWKDVGNKDYPVYRPTNRISKDTPLTPGEIDPENMALQIREKQKIRGKKNLPPFKGKGEFDWGGDEDVYYDESGKEIDKDEYKKQFSDGSEEDLPEQPMFVGDPTQFKPMPFDPNNPMMYRGSGFFDRSYSSAAEHDFHTALEEEAEKKKEKEKKRKKKKESDFGPIDFDKPIEFDSDGDYEGRELFMEGTGNTDDYLKKAKAFAKKAGYKDWKNLKYATDGVHKLELNGVKFGRKGYGDFIEYGMKEGPQKAQKHRKAYLARATKMPGEWKDEPMSKNNLAIKVLWGGSPFHHLRGGSKQPALPPNVDLVSKKESPIVEEIIEEPMDDADIRAYYPNAKIMRYSDLKNYKTITQLLPKDKSYAFLLYQHSPNSGHWVLIMRYGGTIEFFCSYGSAIDAPLKWTNPRDRQMLGEAVPYLTNLLRSQKEFNVIHNPVAYQAKGNDKATCGAHDVMRLSQMLNHGQDLTDYYDYMTKIKKESGLSYDEIVANFVSKR